MAGWILALASLALCVYGHWGGRFEPRHDPRAPAKAPTRPVVASDDGAWLLLPFQLVAGLAWLCWAAILLAMFLAPLLFLAALAWGALQ